MCGVRLHASSGVWLHNDPSPPPPLRRFHGQLTKREAADLLGLEDGRYLVRESLDRPGDYVLSFV